MDHFKACLVAKGCTQVYGADYYDTCSPVAKIASIRLILSMTVMRSWPLISIIHQDIFLHNDLIGEIYMKQHPGFIAQGESELVCQL